MKRQAKFYRATVYAGAIFTLTVLLLIVGYIFVRGIPNLSPELFAWKYNSENVSMTPAIINTLLMTLLSLLFCLPLGIGAAIYLSEYARRGSWPVRIVRMTAETLSGIPSIIYGLFGSMCFVVALRMGLSLLSGALTLSIMVLPTIMRTTEEALLAVPDSYREGSFALGAGRLRTTFQVVLPSAMPGVLSGVILAVGRIVGETAALLYTAGTVAKVPHSLLDSTRTLAVHMYVISTEGLYVDQSNATAVVLLAMAFGINTLSSLIAKKVGRKQA